MLIFLNPHFNFLTAEFHPQVTNFLNKFKTLYFQDFLFFNLILICFSHKIEFFLLSLFSHLFIFVFGYFIYFSLPLIFLYFNQYFILPLDLDNLEFTFDNSSFCFNNSLYFCSSGRVLAELRCSLVRGDVRIYCSVYFNVVNFYGLITALSVRF